MVGRKENIEFPKVWRTFERTMQDGTVKKFKVMDLTEEYYEEAKYLMKEIFFKEEPLTMSTIPNDPIAVENFFAFWEKHVIPQKLSLMCIEEGITFMRSELVGVNFLLHNVKGHEDQFSNSKPEEVDKIITFIESKFNIYDTYGVEEFMGACGIVVNPEYRGMNIAMEIMKAREPLCREMGIKVTETIFSAIGSQVLAAKAGFKTLVELTFDEVSKNTNIKFSENFKTIKIMTNVYD